MKSKMSKKLIAFILCMVLVICNSVSILADTPAPEATTTAQQTKTAGENSDTKKKTIDGTENVSAQSEDSADTKKPSDEDPAPEVKTTEVSTEKKEDSAATDEDKDDPAEVTTKAKEETEKADEPITETTTGEQDETKEAEESSTKEKEEIDGDSDKKDERKATEEENETAPTTQSQAYNGKYEDETVTISVSAEAGIVPEGAELSVTPIVKTDITDDMSDEDKVKAEEVNAQYDLTEKKLAEDSEANEETMEGFLAYDISFIVDGEEVEPNGDVKVVMDFKEAAVPEGVSEEATVAVKHLKEDETAEDGVVVEDMAEKATVETTDKAEIEKVEFIVDSFSSFSLKWGSSSSSQKAKFYYVYVRPDDDGRGYVSEKIWEGDRFATDKDIQGLVQYEERFEDGSATDQLRYRFGCGEDDETLSHNQTLTVGGKTWTDIEFVGGRVYSSNRLDTQNFDNIHEEYKVADYLRLNNDNTYEYRTGTSGEYKELTGRNAVVLLFADRLDYTRADENDYENALEDGKITDYSDRLDGEGDVAVNISKSAEWADYFDRIAEVTFNVDGTPKTEPLDIVLVLDTSYSMDFSNYDWDYSSCSTDTSTTINYDGYERYDRFFEDQNAPNKLNGTSRMEDTKNAAYSFITTFMKNNKEKNEEQRTRVAVISFNDTVTIETDFTDDFNTAINGIERLETNTGTNTGEAIAKANEVLTDKKNDRKCITVVLSDGAPNRPDTDFKAQLAELRQSTDTIYTIGVDLSDTTTIGSSYPGAGQTPKGFLEGIADANCAYNMTSGENMVASCFQEIIEDLTIAAQNAVIHDIIGEYFTYNSSDYNNVTGTSNNDYLTIDIGEVSVVGDKVTFDIKLDDVKRDLVDTYLTNQNNPNVNDDVYVSYKVDKEDGATAVNDNPNVAVYKELVIEYYYEDENGKLMPVRANEIAYKQSFIDQAIDSLKGIDEYQSYDRLTANEVQMGYTLSDADKNAGLNYLSGYSFRRIESDLEESNGTYKLTNDNKENVIKVIYGAQKASVTIKKEVVGGDSSDTSFSITVQDVGNWFSNQVAYPSNETVSVKNGESEKLERIEITPENANSGRYLWLSEPVMSNYAFSTIEIKDNQYSNAEEYPNGYRPAEKISDYIIKVYPENDITIIVKNKKTPTKTITDPNPTIRKSIEYQPTGYDDIVTEEELEDLYRLHLTVDGGEGQQTEGADIVLVLDTTLSMKEEITGSQKTRWEVIEPALESIVNQLMPEGTSNTISIITFWASAERILDQETDKERVIAKIREIDPNKYWTNYDYAMQQTANLVKEIRQQNNEKKQYVIFASDGIPTGYGKPFQTADGISANPDSTYYTYNLPLAKQSAALIQNIDGFYTVGIEAATHTDDTHNITISGESFLREFTYSPIAADYKCLMANDEASITSAFKNVAYAISSRIGGVVIEDKLSEWVDFPLDGSQIDSDLLDAKVVRYLKDNPSQIEEIDQNNYTLVTSAPTKKITVTFNDNYYLTPGYTYELSFNIMVNDTAKDHYSNVKEYPGMGDEGTNYNSEKPTSENQPGFDANEKAVLQYTYGSETNNKEYLIPVVQSHRQDIIWQIIKKSSGETGAALGNAVFKLVGTNGEPTYTGESADGTGIISWEDENENPVSYFNIEKGTYILTETKAPAAHVLSDEKWTIKIEYRGALPTITSDGKNIELIKNEENQIYECVFVNEMLYNLPSTGGPGIYWYTFSGTLLMAGAALIVYRQKRKREVLLRK